MIPKEFSIFIESDFIVIGCFGKANGVHDIPPGIGFKGMIDVISRKILRQIFGNGFLQI